MPLRSKSSAVATCLTLAGLMGAPMSAVQAKASKAKRPASANAGDKPAKADNQDKPARNAYDYSLPGADGKDVPLSTLKGKYVVVVNLARKSTYSEQLAELVKLNDLYKAKNVVVIGVPSNDFGHGEPGTGAEIQKAYGDAKVDFSVMGVAKVSGDDPLPLYEYLTKGKGAPPGGAVHWNYTKFVIDKKGNVVARLDPDVAPTSPEMLSTIDQILDGTYKPKKAGGKPGAGAPADDDDDD